MSDSRRVNEGVISTLRIVFPVLGISLIWGTPFAPRIQGYAANLNYMACVLTFLTACGINGLIDYMMGYILGSFKRKTPLSEMRILSLLLEVGAFVGILANVILPLLLILIYNLGSEGLDWNVIFGQAAQGIIGGWFFVGLVVISGRAQWPRPLFRVFLCGFAEMVVLILLTSEWSKILNHIAPGINWWLTTITVTLSIGLNITLWLSGRFSSEKSKELKEEV